MGLVRMGQLRSILKLGTGGMCMLACRHQLRMSLAVTLCWQNHVAPPPMFDGCTSLASPPCTAAHSLRLRVHHDILGSIGCFMGYMVTFGAFLDEVWPAWVYDAFLCTIRLGCFMQYINDVMLRI